MLQQRKVWITPFPTSLSTLTPPKNRLQLPGRLRHSARRLVCSSRGWSSRFLSWRWMDMALLHLKNRLKITIKLSGNKHHTIMVLSNSYIVSPDACDLLYRFCGSISGAKKCGNATTSRTNIGQGWPESHLPNPSGQGCFGQGAAPWCFGLSKLFPNLN